MPPLGERFHRIIRNRLPSQHASPWSLSLDDFQVIGDRFSALISAGLSRALEPMLEIP